jgi:ribonuclease VapC
MIVVDTSALMAILLGEPEARACRGAIADHEDLLIAALTLTETLIVAAGRRLRPEMTQLINDLFPAVAPLTEARAYAALEAYLSWGRGFHKAGLNFGDCFAYALAMEHDCGLLYVGEDFARTDVTAALG